jgi:hypothetical protein
MPYIAVVELALSEDARSISPQQSALLRAAYEASHRESVLLLIPEGSRRLVDRALDAPVASNRWVRGLVYREVSDPHLAVGLGPNTLFVGSSPRLRAAAESMGARCIPTDAGLGVLQSWAPKEPRTQTANPKGRPVRRFDSAPRDVSNARETLLPV